MLTFKPNPKPKQKKRKKTSKSEAAHFASRHGTDKQYLEWLSFQPSCIDNAFNQFDDVGRNIACHVRRAGACGMAIKPVYSAVPMTSEQHQAQSLYGEAYVLHKYLGQNYSIEQAQAWFDKQSMKYLLKWISKTNLQQAGQIGRAVE